MAQINQKDSNIMTMRWSATARILMAVYREIKGGAGIIYTIITMHLLSANRWLAQRYNVNNAWNFNGTNGNLNNNNVNNTITVQAVVNLTYLFKM